MLMSDLILSVLPRVGNIEKPNGISIYRAATAIQSIIAKRLLDRKSDLLATGSLSLQIPAYGYSAALPDDFFSLPSRPYSEELFINWMAGTVTSYDAETGELVFNATACSGTDTLAAWVVSSAGVPGTYAQNIGTSTSSNAVGTGLKTFTVEPDLDIIAGQYMIISAENSPDGWEGRRQKLEPSYLNADDDKDVLWWETYALNSDDTGSPSRYQVLGDSLYIRPKPIVDVLVKGIYNQLPGPLTLPTQTIPWKGKFDELFIEGSIMILALGFSVPEASQPFMALFDREFNTVINSRAALLPKTGRLRRSDYL